jgi:hypothetical protein
MSNVIRFLEWMGRDAALQQATGENLKVALERTQLEPQAQEAILINDQSRIAALSGATITTCCAIAPGKDDDDEDEPMRDDDEINAQLAVDCVV